MQNNKKHFERHVKEKILKSVFHACVSAYLTVGADVEVIFLSDAYTTLPGGLAPTRGRAFSRFCCVERNLLMSALPGEVLLEV